eukprot:c23189_g1_i2 orf=199-360(+)
MAFGLLGTEELVYVAIDYCRESWNYLDLKDCWKLIITSILTGSGFVLNGRVLF